MQGHIGPMVYLVGMEAEEKHRLAALLHSVELTVEDRFGLDEVCRTHPAELPGCALIDLESGAFSQFQSEHSIPWPQPPPLSLVVIGGAGVDVRTAVEIMRQNAFDFLIRPLNDQQLLDCVHRALRHDEERAAEAAARRNLMSRLAMLTPREREVLTAVVEGGSNQEVAIRLGISPKTVEVHRTRLQRKLGAQCYPELVRMGVLGGLIPEVPALPAEEDERKSARG